MCIAASDVKLCRYLHDRNASLNCHHENLIEFSCCPKVPRPTYTYSVGSTKRTPKLLNWGCVRNECNHCGIQDKLDLFKCKILSDNSNEIEVLEWIYTERKGENKDGIKNTQLEFGRSCLFLLKKFCIVWF